MRRFFRIAKGIYMGLMYAIFGTAIWIELIVVVPVLWFIEKFLGPSPLRMQQLNRFLFSIWIGLLFLGGLLHAKRFRGQIPDGEFVVVANHPGLFDVLVLIREIPKLSVFVKGALIKELPLARILTSAGFIVVPDMGGFGGLETLQRGTEVLRQGYRLMLFPEGTRSPKGELLPFKAGAHKMAQRANVPILPVLIKNVPPFLPHEDRWYFPLFELSRLELELWDPIPPPAPGEERTAALELENRYRRALGLDNRQPTSRTRKRRPLGATQVA
jgi:1-acyl-sn-glycerol-3-phosphate acyltransferase